MEETEYSSVSLSDDEEDDSRMTKKKKELMLDLKSIKEVIKKHYSEAES